jgi:hypothetical protein
MASSSNGAAKVADCMGNHTGSLKPKAWSVVTYNAGLHDCAHKRKYVSPVQYRANLKAILETIKPAAAATVFVTTTPYDMPLTNGIDMSWGGRHAGIEMSCILHYNSIARQVAREVGDVIVEDLYGYVEDFCQWFPKDPGNSSWAGNYTSCAIQTSGLHFFNVAPFPSGMQYTGISVAQAAIRHLPNADINNKSAGVVLADLPTLMEPLGSCGNAPAPLSSSTPNVLVIGDSISEPGSGE